MLFDTQGKRGYILKRGNLTKLILVSFIIFSVFSIFSVPFVKAKTYQLTFTSAEDNHPCINDDGSVIAFHSDVDGDEEIFVVTFDGVGWSSPVQITHNSAYISPSIV